MEYWLPWKGKRRHVIRTITLTSQCVLGTGHYREGGYKTGAHEVLPLQKGGGGQKKL